jgi:flagellar hook-length control protein FliK
MDPMIWRVEVRAESAAQTWGGTGEGAARTQGATPAAVLSRLTEFQQKMTVESMVQSALPAFQGKRESITIDLNPPELGRVQVRVENNGVGVNAVLTVQDRGLGEFFQGQSDLIRKNLEEAGIRVGQLSVEVRQQMSREAGERPAATAGKSGRGAGSTSIHSLGIAESARKEHRWGRNALSQVDMMV